MLLRSPRPMRRKHSSIPAYRKRIPADLLHVAAGRSLRVVFPATASDPTADFTANIGKEQVLFSLRTRDPATAKARNGIATATLEAFFAALRDNKPTTISERHAAAMAGDLYRNVVAALGDNPSNAAGFLYPKPGQSWRDELSIPTDEAVEARVGVATDAVLHNHGIVAGVDPTSRKRLVAAVDAAFAHAGSTLQRNAGGNWSDDAKASHYPPLEPLPKPPAPATKPANGPTWKALIAAWEHRHVAADKQPATRKQVRSIVERFAAWVKKPPLEVTRADINGWIERRRTAGISAATISTNDVPYLRRMYQVGKLADLIPETHTDPTSRIEVPTPSATSQAGRRSQRRGYTDNEAATILAAASKETDPLLRYVPLILAYSGARASEVVNLRACDIASIDGTASFVVTPDAGRHVKNEHSIRSIPLHRAITDAGFLNFAATKSGDARLFYTAARERHGIGALKPGKKALAKLRRWLRAIPGLQVGKAHGVDPNHAWRHRLKTKARDAGIDGAIIDAICGHAPASVGAGYGEYSVTAKAAALNKLA